MKKGNLATIAISILLVSVATGIQSMEEAKANFGPVPTTPPSVTIVNPANASTQSNSVAVVFNVTFFDVTFFGDSLFYRIEFNYKLDGWYSTNIKPIGISSSKLTPNSLRRQCTFTIANLSDGSHKIQVFAKIGKTESTTGSSWYYKSVEGFSNPVTFKVVTPPSITNLSIENRTYRQTALPLNFTVDKSASWIGYSLDNQLNVTLSGNETVSNFVAGYHSLVVYANDTEGNMGKSDAVFFTIETQSSPSLTARLSESASALNFGSNVNFTVTVEGGMAPYTYAWYMDNSLVENGTSPHYSTDSQQVGSHHVYVEVKDADGNSATTLTVEFNVLPTANSASPTQQPTSFAPQLDGLQPNLTMLYIFAGIIVLVIIIAIGAVVFYKRRRG
jgi:hypothetical protein